MVGKFLLKEQANKAITDIRVFRRCSLAAAAGHRASNDLANDSIYACLVWLKCRLMSGQFHDRDIVTPVVLPQHEFVDLCLENNRKVDRLLFLDLFLWSIYTSVERRERRIKNRWEGLCDSVYFGLHQSSITILQELEMRSVINVSHAWRHYYPATDVLNFAVHVTSAVQDWNISHTTMKQSMNVLHRFFQWKMSSFSYFQALFCCVPNLTFLHSWNSPGNRCLNFCP